MSGLIWGQKIYVALQPQKKPQTRKLSWSLLTIWVLFPLLYHNLFKKPIFFPADEYFLLYWGLLKFHWILVVRFHLKFNEIPSSLINLLLTLKFDEISSICWMKFYPLFLLSLQRKIVINPSNQGPQVFTSLLPCWNPRKWSLFSSWCLGLKLFGFICVYK